MNPKQDRFCREYLIDLNATQAAIRAGYSPTSAAATACRLMKRPEIARCISEMKTKQAQRLQRTADDVLRRLWQIADADPTQAFDEEGKVRNPADLPDELKPTLASIKVGDTVEIKLTDRLKALELLGRHLAMFTDRVQSETQATGKVVIYLPDNGRNSPQEDRTECDSE